jgi:hypothetical protein
MYFLQLGFIGAFNTQSGPTGSDTEEPRHGIRQQIENSKTEMWKPCEERLLLKYHVARFFSELV